MSPYFFSTTTTLSFNNRPHLPMYPSISHFPDQEILFFLNTFIQNHLKKKKVLNVHLNVMGRHIFIARTKFITQPPNHHPMLIRKNNSSPFFSPFIPISRKLTVKDIIGLYGKQEENNYLSKEHFLTSDKN